MLNKKGSGKNWKNKNKSNFNKITKGNKKRNG